MGQKTHPYAFRIGIVNDWKSRWFSHKDYTKLVNQDYRLREFLTGELIKGAVSRIEIERTRDKCTLILAGGLKSLSRWDFARGRGAICRSFSSLGSDG